MLNRWLLVSVLVASFSLNGMDEFSRINKTKQLLPFVGKIVAFKVAPTFEESMVERHGNYHHLYPGSTIGVGYVDADFVYDGYYDFIIARLLNKRAISSVWSSLYGLDSDAVICQYRMRESSELAVRLANKSELTKVKKMLATGEARFDYQSTIDRGVKRALARQLYEKDLS